MKKKNRNFVKLTAVGFASVFMLSGCGITKMTDEQMKVIADYAADVLVRYDASYYDRFAEEKRRSEEEDNTLLASNETAPPETKQPATEMPKSEAPQISAEPVVQPDAATPAPVNTAAPADPANVADSGVTPMEVGKIFGLDDVEISYRGYDVLDQYPDVGSDQLAFQMKATENHKLYVFKFEILNTSSEARNCNILGQNIKFRVRVNDTENLSVQKTLLADDLSQINAVLQSMESKTGVVVCQVPSDYNPEVSALSLVVRTGGEDKVIKLQ